MMNGMFRLELDPDTLTALNGINTSDGINTEETEGGVPDEIGGDGSATL